MKMNQLKQKIEEVRKSGEYRYRAIQKYANRYNYWEKTVEVRKHLREKAYAEYACEVLMAG